MSAPRIRYHLNVQAALVLTALGLAAALGLYFLAGYQEDRILRSALAQVKEFRSAGEKEKDPEKRQRDLNLALRHVSHYLVLRPNDPDALEIQAQLLAGSDPLGSVPAYEHLLRLDPDGPRAQETRRRLAALDIEFSIRVLNSPIARLQPEEAYQRLKFQTAELLTDQLLDPKNKPRIDDAEAHRLRAIALEGQITPGNIRPVKDENGEIVTRPVRDKNGNVRNEPVTIEVLDYAIQEYRAALRRDPGDLVATHNLARLYLEKKKDTGKARELYVGLLKARPDSVDVRLACHLFYKGIGDQDAATAELDAAARLAPGNPDLILLRAEYALRKGRRGTREALGLLDTLPKDARDDRVTIKALKIRGLAEYLEQHRTEAVNLWHEGVERSNGTDGDLIWQEAYVLLELGADEKAKKLVEQLRRLAGDDHPRLHWLEALQHERTGQFDRAIELLKAARDKMMAEDPGVQAEVRLALGRCQEKRQDLDVERTFREAIKLAPTAVQPRIALAQFLLSRNPVEAARVLEQGLESNADDALLLMNLAAAFLRQQLTRPSDQRDWANFDIAFKRADIAFRREAAGMQNAFLVQLHAERLAASDQPDQAVEFLQRAIASEPRNAQLAITLADVRFKQGRPDQALQVLEHASAPEAAGDRGNLRTARARLLNALGRGREARALLLSDLNKVPPADRADVWRTLFLLCLSHGDPNTTRAAFTEWERQLPDDARPKFALLEMAIGTNNEKAISERLAQLHPNTGKDARPNQDEDARSDLDVLLGDVAKARFILWKESVTRANAQAQGKNTPAGITLDREADTLLEEASALVEGLRGNYPSDPTLLFLQGLIYEQKKSMEKAIDRFRQAWTSGSQDALLHLVNRLTWKAPNAPFTTRQRRQLDELRESDLTKHLDLDQIVAVSCLRNNNRDEAVRIVELARSEPGKAKPWHAELYESLGDSRNAEDVLRKLVEQEPDKLETWLRLVQYDARHGHSAAAAATIAKVMERFKTERPELLEAQFRTAAADWPGAEKAFDQALRRYPDDPTVLLAAADYFERAGNHDRAEACLRHVLDRDPSDRAAARKLAYLISARPEAWAQALALLGPEGSPTETAEDRLCRGFVLARSGDVAQREKGAKLLEMLVDDLPVEAGVAITAREALAKLLLASGQAAQASRIAAISASSVADPNAIALYAESLIRSGQFEVADGQIDRLAKSGAGGDLEAKLRARLIHGRSLQDQAKPNRAAETLEQTYLAREKTPGGEAFGREAFPMLVALGPDARAVAERLSRRLAQHNPALSWMPASLMASRGDRDEALALCRTAAQAGGNPADLHQASRIALEVAVASRALDSTLNRADEVLAEALRHAPSDDDLLVMKALISHLQGRFDEEVRLYRIVLKNQPRNDVVLNNLAYALSEGLDKPSEALEKINELITLTGGRNPEFLDTRGVILMRLGRLDQAIKDLEDAVHSAPNGLHFFHLARAYQLAGQVAESRTALKQAQQSGLNPATIDPKERAAYEMLLNL